MSMLDASVVRGILHLGSALLARVVRVERPRFLHLSCAPTAH